MIVHDQELDSPQFSIPRCCFEAVRLPTEQPRTLTGGGQELRLAY